jgi:hypothetical protein
MFNLADGWSKCPRGELERLAARLRLRRRTRLALTVLTGILTGLLATTLAIAGVRLSHDLFGLGGSSHHQLCPAPTSSGTGCSVLIPTTAPEDSCPTPPLTTPTTAKK